MTPYQERLFKRLKNEFPKMSDDDILAVIDCEPGEHNKKFPDMPEGEGLTMNGKNYYRKNGYWGYNCWRGHFMTLHEHLSQMRMDCRYLQKETK